MKENNMKENTIKSNKFFTIYFALFFTLYQFGVVQLCLYIFLAVYVFLNFAKKKNYIVDKKMKNKLLFLLGWFGIFTLYAILSKKWAIGIYSDSNTIITLLRMLFVGIMIFIYCDTKEKAVSIMKSYIYGIVIMCIVLLLFTPVSLYGVEYGDDFFGKIIRQHRNTIASSSVESIFYIIFLTKYFNVKFHKFIFVLLGFVIIVSGSRGALIELLFFTFIYFLFNIKYKKTFKYIPLIMITILILYFLVISIPFLYDKFFLRFVDMINTLTSGGIVDGSTYSRSLMKKVAFDIFKSYPLFGAGLDGVVVFLSEYPAHYGYRFRAVYSHCNYTEIAANFGIIGLFLWYNPLILSLKKMMQKINIDGSIKFIICIFLAILFVDNYKIPWTSDVSMISYFILLNYILCYLNASTNVNKGVRK